MKTVKMQGGLGNQLFCLAFARSLTLATGERAALDLAGFAADRYGRRFALTPLAEALGLSAVERRLLAARPLRTLAPLIPGLGATGEPSPPTDEEALACFARAYRRFDGYWQDEAWILDPEPLVEAIRGFVGAKDAPAHDLVIHYRSYKEERVASRRATPDAAWFACAVAAAEGEGGRGGGELVLVSDDPALARAAIGPLAARAVTPPAAGPLADLALIMRARALVLSNSSFSWWGGFCGEAQRIVYPARNGLYHWPRPARRFTVLSGPRAP